MTRRWLCLLLPHLSCDRLSRERPALRRAPFVCIERSGQTQRVTAVSRAATAAAQGHRLTGMTLTAARAVCPGLLAVDGDQRADLAAMEELAAWAQRLGSPVSLYSDDTLVIEIGGSAHLFAPVGGDAGPGRPGEAELVRTALRGLARLGYSARAAVADTPRGAAALAAGGGTVSTIVAPASSRLFGGETAFNRLPLAALSLEPGTLGDLAELGLLTVGGVLCLPRESLAARFGAELPRRLAELLGEAVEAPRAFAPSSILCERLEFDPAMADGDGLSFVVKRLADRMAERLAGSVKGALAMLLTITFDPCRGAPPPLKLDVRAAEPQDRARALLMLLRVKLESAEVPDGALIVSVELEVTKAAAVPGRWQSMFEPKPSRDAEGVAALVDRLSARLGADNVARAVLADDWLPERSWRAVPYLSGEAEAEEAREKPKRKQWRDYDGSFAAEPAAPTGGLQVLARDAEAAEALPTRPTRLLAEPRRIAVLADCGAPVAVGGVAVISCDGPERVVTGWWRRPDSGQPDARDYWSVVLADGMNLWLFRDPAGIWFEHGAFA